MPLIHTYIANQLTDEGLDELQRMVICAVLKHNIALDGPPGVGKTEAAETLGKLLSKKVHLKGCSEDTTESQIISFPVLQEKNGATVTAYIDGPLTAAMRNGEIFYADEFNLLRMDKQKRLNSAFDSRRRIVTTNNEAVTAKDGFIGIVSYNPSVSMVVRDLENSVADRFVHICFRYIPAKLESYISVLKASLKYNTKLPAPTDYNIVLQKRGMLFSGNSVRFMIKHGSNGWLDFFTLTPIQENQLNNTSNRIYEYFTYVPDGNTSIRKVPSGNNANKINEQVVAIQLNRFFEIVRSLADHGTSKLPKDLKRFFKDFEMFTNLQLHKPSLRISQAAVEQFMFLVDSGQDRLKALHSVSALCIDQICYGQYGCRLIGDKTVRDIIRYIAELYKLLPESRHLRTDLNQESGRI